MTRTETAPHILVLDDEPYICEIVAEALSADGYTITPFTDPEAAIDWVQEHEVDLVLTDLLMPTRSGVQVLLAVRAVHPDAIVVLMTAHPTVETAIKALTQGAYDFLIKPFKLDQLRATVHRGVEHQKAVRDNLNLKRQVDFLQATSSADFHADLDHYLQTVLTSLEVELDADRAVLFEIEPATRSIARVVTRTDRPLFTAELSDQLISELAARNQPGLRMRRMIVDGPEHQRFEVRIVLPLIAAGELQGVIQVTILSRFGRITSGQLDVFRLLGNAAATALHSHRLYQNLRRSYLQAIRALANAIEARDPYTSGHTDRVMILAEKVARHLNWNERQIEQLVVGCTLHDIGKIGVPDAVLNKSGKLDDLERDQMKKHTKVGLKIVSGIDLLRPATAYILSHHERFDGRGYPEGLKGEEIPIEGRLLAVVDTFDAMVSDRPYRNGVSIDLAVAEIIAHTGSQFDPCIVDAFLAVLREHQVDFESLYGRPFDLTRLDEILTTDRMSASLSVQS